MLSVFRNHTKKIFWGLVAIIIPGFSLWGISATMMDRANNPVLGTVLGVEVTQRQFMAEKASVRRLLEIELADMVGGAGYNRDWVRNYIQTQDIDSLAWKRIALAAMAEKYGFESGRQIVAAWLKDIKMFNTEAGFDYGAYIAFLKNVLHVDPVMFEEEMREEMLSRIMLKILTSASFVSAVDESELKRMRFERINLRAAVFSAATVKLDPALVAEEELLKYFNENKEDFRLPVRRRGRFIFVPYSSASEPEVTDDNVKAVYEANSSVFTNEDSSLKPMAEVADQIKAQIKESMRAEAVRDRVRAVYYSLVRAGKQADFTAAAKAEGLEVGKIDWISEDAAEEAEKLAKGAGEAGFIKDFFALDVGSVCTPLAADEGVMLFVADKEEISRIPEFADVRADVELACRSAKGLELARKKARDFAMSADVSAVDAFAASAVEAGADVSGKDESFALLSPSGIARGFSSSDLIRLFSCKEKSLSPSFDTQDGAVVFFVDSYKTVAPEEGKERTKESELMRQAQYKKQMMSVEEMFSGISAAK